MNPFNKQITKTMIVLRSAIQFFVTVLGCHTVISCVIIGVFQDSPEAKGEGLSRGFSMW